MKTYVFLDWSGGIGGVHVAQLDLADDTAALAYLVAHYGPEHTCEEVLQAGNRCVMP